MITPLPALPLTTCKYAEFKDLIGGLASEYAHK